MSSDMPVVIAHVQPEEARDAFLWHQGFSSANDHLFPRTLEEYDQFAENRQLRCARDDDGNYLGFCYHRQDEETLEWELGGVMVGVQQRGKSLGLILLSVTLGDLLIDSSPLDEGQWVISHVVEGNPMPRGLLTTHLKFKHRKELVIPGHMLPGLHTQDDGNVHGDEFEMTVPETLCSLANWCDDWTGTLRDGTPAEIELREPNARTVGRGFQGNGGRARITDRTFGNALAYNDFGDSPRHERRNA